MLSFLFAVGAGIALGDAWRAFKDTDDFIGWEAGFWFVLAILCIALHVIVEIRR